MKTKRRLAIEGRNIVAYTDRFVPRKEDAALIPWEAEYHNDTIVRGLDYDGIVRSELKCFHLIDISGKRLYTLTIEPGDVLLYRKRTSKVLELECPTLTKKELNKQLDKLSQSDLAYAIATQDFSLLGVEGVTFGELRKLVYIVGHIDTDLEVVHLSTFSSDGEEIDKWVGSVEEMDIELRPVELIQLESLNKALYTQYRSV